MTLSVRPADVHDAEAVAWIYNAGIADRAATFDTEPRTGLDGVWRDVITVERLLGAAAE